MISRSIPMVVVTVSLALVLGGGCSSDDDEKPKDSGPDISFIPDTAPSPCGTGIYPCGPYGVNIDDVTKNLEFVGYSDPKEHCKEHKDKVMDTTTSRRISFKEFHLGDSSCTQYKREILWVMVSAGWCTPCQKEVSKTQNEYALNQVDQRVAILNILTETDNLSEPATDAFIKKWIQSFNLTFPVGMDPSFKLGAYFDVKAVPFNMLIETKTMKIIYRETGENLPGVGAKIQSYFLGK